MKLKKLLPLSFVTVTSIATGLSISSCSKSVEPEPEPEPEIIYQTVKTEDIFGKSFERTTNILPKQPFHNTDEALLVYLINAQENNQIYTDDVFLSAQAVLSYWLEQERQSASWGLKGFNGTADFGIANVDLESKRLTYGIKLDTTITAWLKDYLDITIKFNVSFDILAKNIQFDIDYAPLTETTGQWWAHAAYIAGWKDPKDTTIQTLNINSMREDKDWSLELDAKVSILESTIPGIGGNVAMIGKYNYQSVDNDDSENSLFWLQILYSYLWHRVDYLSSTYI